MVQVWLAGEASQLPVASQARTSKVWLPVASDVYDFDDTHAE